MKLKSTSLRRSPWLVLALTLFLGAPNLLGDYIQTNLVSNSSATPANFTDPNLVNPWGLVSNAGSPFWVSDQGTSVSTLYDGSGNKIPLTVSIPSVGPPTGPTGIVANTTSFKVNGSPAAFIFSTLDGEIVGWNGTPLTSGVTEATVAGAIFTGLAQASIGSANFLYAADFTSSGGIDVFNGQFKNVPGLSNKFKDPNLPAGYEPYNVAPINGKLYVEYAPIGSNGLPVVGNGNGIVDVFDTNGNFVKRLISNGGALNVPWGIALAPASFGKFGGDLLVGNFGNGWINAFNPTTGAFIGTLDLSNGMPFAEPALWSLDFGIGGKGGTPGVLYFTSGVTLSQTSGLFGSISTTPEPASLALLGSGIAALLGLRRKRSVPGITLKH